MRLVKAVVVKRDTSDGIPFLLDDVPIGFTYMADLDSIAELEWYNIDRNQVTKRQSIRVYGSATGKGAITGDMPLELFSLGVQE